MSRKGGTETYLPCFKMLYANIKCMIFKANVDRKRIVGFHLHYAGCAFAHCWSEANSIGMPWSTGIMIVLASERIQTQDYQTEMTPYNWMPNPLHQNLAQVKVKFMN